VLSVCRESVMGTLHERPSGLTGPNLDNTLAQGVCRERHNGVTLNWLEIEGERGTTSDSSASRLGCPIWE
jgi:hypothetical protein